MKSENSHTLSGITTAALASEQVDLLYSIPEAGNKDLTWQEGQKVVMTFRHALSQIRISASTDQDYSAYYSTIIRKVELLGIHDSGDLDLAAATAETSPWSNQSTASTGSESSYIATTGELNIPLAATEALLNADVNSFMQIPQVIDAGGAQIRITYDVEATEAGNASNAGIGKTTVISIPVITWAHNHIYHYKVQMNLEQLLSLKPVKLGDPDIVEWENGTEIKLPKDLTVTIKPSGEGETGQTATGNATLEVTKSNQAGETLEVNIANPEKNDSWIVEVGPENTVSGGAVTRVARKTVEPATWLRVCKKRIRMMIVN